MEHVRLDERIREKLAGQVPIKILRESKYLPLHIIKECGIEDIPEKLLHTDVFAKTRYGYPPKKFTIPNREYFALKDIMLFEGEHKNEFSDRDYNNGVWFENNHVVKLNLRGGYNISIAPSLEDFCELKHLEIYGFDLKILPEFICNLGNLEYLSIYNRGTGDPLELTASISNLKNLKALYLYSNSISSVPESIGDLKNLKRLNLSHNNLSSLPESIGNLKNLKELFLHDNKLRELPESIGDLENLEYLALYRNSLKKLPDSIGNLRKLSNMELQYNKLRKLPKPVYKMPKLTSINYGKNRFGPVRHVVIYKGFKKRRKK